MVVLIATISDAKLRNPDRLEIAAARIPFMFRLASAQASARGTSAKRSSAKRPQATNTTLSTLMAILPCPDVAAKDVCCQHIR